VKVHLRGTAFDPWEELSRYRAATTAHRPGAYGATACFVGTMRDFNQGDSVCSLSLEHYPGMTERQLERLQVQAHQRWSLVDSLIVHRYGEVFPGEPLVVVATWSVHRAAALEACRFLIEELKARAPFWKLERLPTGQRWVEHNTPG
jgi:molybdopterin synthase catalytic subunit